jgi:ribosomal protein S18 acetylase RimI-like enzyme
LYEKQRNLFFVAEENEKVVGAIMSGVKPWFDGNRLIDTELFVDKNYQNRHLAREL